MNRFKYLSIIFLILSLTQIVMAEKRIKPKSMQELTDPSSPSFVPYPYPKTNEEIIADINSKERIIKGTKNV